MLLLCVRHRVSGDTICCRSSLRLIPVFSLSPFKHVLFSMCPLAVLSHVRPRFTYNTSFSYILGNYGHARSHGGRQPAAVKPVLYVRIEYVYTCIHISVHARMRWGWGHPALGASPFSPRGPTGERILLLAATTVSSCTSSTILDKPLGHSAKSSFANEKGSSLRCAVCQTRKWWRSCREGCRGTNARHLIGSNFGKNS